MLPLLYKVKQNEASVLWFYITNIPKIPRLGGIGSVIFNYV